jgi:murein DD-endopeptidase MepM/ murein hydrolase activator NlpD
MTVINSDGPILKWIIAAAGLVLVAVVLYLALPPAHEPVPVQAVEYEEYVPELDEFGIPHHAYQVQSGVVAPRQTLSHILARFDLGPAEIDAIAAQMLDVFNPRRIRAGNSYHGYFKPEDSLSISYFVYEISQLEYVMVHFDDIVNVSREAKEVDTRIQTAVGIIRSSLWNVLRDNGLHPELAIRLSEVLAWEVDFYRIQDGDRFKVVYQEDFVGDRSVGIPAIDAVFFVHQGRDILGFRFEEDTLSGFYNPQGENLRKVFLKAPLEFVRITSRYSHSRLHPILNQRRPHYGTDYAAPHGTPILAVGDGVVTEARYSSGNGNYVRIRHNSVYETQYLHMSRFGNGIRPGARVTQGQVIGYVGSTGLATGPHVCFRFWKNGQQVDHLREEFPSADPLPVDYHGQFAVIRDSLMHILNGLEFHERGI